MLISILTLFPDMFQGPFAHSIVKRAVDRQLITIEIINIRDFGIGKHRVVDDSAYGGGVGMVMRVDVLHQAIQYACEKHADKQKRKIVLTSAKGETYSQQLAQEYASLDHLIIICGHYEGVDERITHFIDEELSIGQYILTGGEIPAMVITDSVTRLLKGVLKPEATSRESFTLSNNTTNEPVLEYPQYTRPGEYQGMRVPDILLSGNHKEINQWQTEQTKSNRSKS